MKPKVLLDPHIRSVQSTFTPEDFARLDNMVEIIFGEDELMPVEAFEEIKQELFATISCWWRYGDVREMQVVQPEIIHLFKANFQVGVAGEANINSNTDSSGCKPLVAYWFGDALGL